MKVTRIFSALLFVFAFAGCKSAATDGQINRMCERKLEVSGTLRGTSYEDESKRISKEYQKKEADLRAEMNRDLKGMDDVLSVRLKDIEAEAGADKDKKIAAAQKDIDKKKKAIVDQFEPLIAKLQPQKAYALKDAKEYTDKRATAAQKAKDKCLQEAKDSNISEKTALCRIQSDSPDKYNDCP
jgi:hypothetical protein